MVDGFPLTRENWAAMIEHELLPDFVLSLVDEKAPTDYLLTRFTEMHGLPHPVAQKATQDQEEKEEDGETKEEGAEETESGEKVLPYSLKIVPPLIISPPFRFASYYHRKEDI